MEQLVRALAPAAQDLLVQAETVEFLEAAEQEATEALAEAEALAVLMQPLILAQAAAREVKEVLMPLTDQAVPEERLHLH